MGARLQTLQDWREQQALNSASVSTSARSSTPRPTNEKITAVEGSKRAAQAALEAAQSGVSALNAELGEQEPDEGCARVRWRTAANCLRACRVGSPLRQPDRVDQAPPHAPCVAGGSAASATPRCSRRSGSRCSARKR